MVRSIKGPGGWRYTSENMMRHLFLSFLIVTFVTALSREQNVEDKGEGEAVAEEKSRPTRWATPSADQGNGAGAALAGVPPAANPVSSLSSYFSFHLNNITTYCIFRFWPDLSVA